MAYNPSGIKFVADPYNMFRHNMFSRDALAERAEARLPSIPPPGADARSASASRLNEFVVAL